MKRTLNSSRPVALRRLAAHQGSGAPRAVALALLATVLLFGVGFGLSVAAPRSPATASEAAGELLQQARANREVFPAGFPGFHSRMKVTLDGQVLDGTCTFSMLGRLELTLGDAEVPPRVRATVRSMLMHRMPSSRGAAEEGVAFGKPDGNFLGREILLPDRYESSYRIRDREIIQVDRRLADPRLVLTVLETRTTHTGRYLPRNVFAVRLDPGSGSVLEAWSYISEFQRLGDAYVPMSRQVVGTGGEGTSTLLIEWSEVELLDPEEQE